MTMKTPMKKSQDNVRWNWDQKDSCVLKYIKLLIVWIPISWKIFLKWKQITELSGKNIS